MTMKPGSVRQASVMFMLAALGTVGSAQEAISEKRIVAAQSAQSAQSAQPKPTKDDEVRAAVAVYALADSPPGTCFYLLVPPFATQAGPALESLFRKRARRHDQATACAGSKFAELYIGDVYWSYGGRTASVSAGALAVGTEGRPVYYLKRNLFGRWRVYHVALAE